MVGRFQVTFSDDARRPKVVTFGGSPLVNWYAYLRDGESGRLYLQREEDGVLAAEVLVAEANDPGINIADSIGVTWFDFVEDQGDATKSHLYFLADGTLWRITVTSTPAGEEPTTQQFDRINNRFERMTAVFETGSTFEPFFTEPRIPTPSILITQTDNPAFNRLIINVPGVAQDIFEPDIVELVKMPNGGDGALDSTFIIPATRNIVYIIPANAVTFTTWAARCVRFIPDLKSVYGRVIDDGVFDTEALENAPFQTGATFEPFFRKVDRTPIKRAFDEPDAVTTFATGTTFEPFIRKVDRTPIKRAFDEPDTSIPFATGTTFEPFFRKA